jgi:hypothetical protein
LQHPIGDFLLVHHHVIDLELSEVRDFIDQVGADKRLAVIIQQAGRLGNDVAFKACGNGDDQAAGLGHARRVPNGTGMDAPFLTQSMGAART